MRFPWRGRSKHPAADTRPSAPAARSRAWEQTPPLRASVAVRPPLTARAGDHAADVATRLRSTSVLVHLPRAAVVPRLPEVAGTMAGIATVSSAMTVDSPVSRDQPRSSGTVTQPAVAAPKPRVVPVRQALDPPAVLLRLDPDTASTITPPRRVSRSRARQMDSSEPLAAAAPDVEPAEELPAVGEPSWQPRRHIVSPLPAPVPGHTVVRRRQQAAEPRRVGLQAPLEAPRTPAEPVRARATSAPAVVEQVPERVASAMMHLHRADLREVPVVRGEAATRLAETMHAKALTVSREVFVPPDRGSLESSENRGLVAHELTHVLQQRRLGADVPMEHTPLGRALEAQAAATERIVRGDPGSAAAPFEEPRPATGQPQAQAELDAVRAVQDEFTASGFATRAPDGSLIFAAAATSPVQTGAPVQRAPDTPEAGPAPDGEPAPSTASAQPGAGASPTISPPTTVPSPFVLQESAPTGGPAPSQSSPGVTLGAPTVVAQEEPPAAPIASAPAQDIDEMARKLYDRVSARLRTELTLDRERAGLLTDLR